MSDQILSSVMDALPTPVLVIDSDDRISLCNKAAALLVGDGLTGRHYIAALRQPAVRDAVSQVRKGKRHVTASYGGRDGTEDTTYRLNITAAGALIVIAFEDRTAAEGVNQFRRQFVANVSHELRTPLTTLLGFIETLGGAARDDAAARDRFLKIMQDEALRMTRLVDDLLSLSRVEEDARVRPRDPVDLGKCLRDVLDTLGPQITKAGVTTQLDLPDAPCVVAGDAGQLSQVFRNVIENALKYGAAGGKVAITLDPPAQRQRLRGEGVRVQVRDFGGGIASHHVARLTERFYRVDDHRSRAVGGTGLGLAIVKHIVNRHRGALQIESVLGQGTDVNVFLPTGPMS